MKNIDQIMTWGIVALCIVLVGVLFMSCSKGDDELSCYCGEGTSSFTENGKLIMEDEDFGDCISLQDRRDVEEELKKFSSTIIWKNSCI